MANKCWPRGEYTCQGGLLMANQAQIYNQSPAAIVREASHARCEKPQGNLPSLLSCAPAFWVHPCERAPRIKMLPIRLRLSPSNQSWAAISTFAFHQPIRMAPFWPMRMLYLDQANYIWRSHLHRHGPSRDKVWKLLSQPPPCLLEHTFSFHWKLCFLAEAVTPERSCLAGAKWSCLVWAELWRGSCDTAASLCGLPQTTCPKLCCSISMLANNWTVSQLMFDWIKSSCSPNPEFGNLVDTELAVMTF